MHYKTLRTLLEVLDVAARERDTDLVDLGSGDGGTRGVVFLFTLSDVTHPWSSGESDGDCKQIFEWVILRLRFRMVT